MDNLPEEDWIVHFNRERMIIEREKINIINNELKTQNGNDKKTNGVPVKVSDNSRPIQHTL